MSENLKAKAAAEALKDVQSGMRLGIGTGSTANEMIKILAEKVANGLDIVGVPTSTASEQLCQELGVPLSTLDETPELDLTIDGADEVDSQLTLVKGGGGALLREKMVAMASKKMSVIVDESKMVPHLGSFPLPIEVQKFGLAATRGALLNHFANSGVAGELVLRQKNSTPYITDNGNYILDAHLNVIHDPVKLASGMNDIPGVVEHGLFVNVASTVIIAAKDGIKRLEA
ncbi:ribose-5-phosphate isomerase RpiA [Polycladidibacter stylochi]|uniref:ribose-5-phosphate isomerase RpiA n=1 Tax=Polycladidibacter stylochi TaxID=1807766 RepID=UPI000832B847|nr:ribose-5-phosphate isomerase RpiA [Pseudovibrio stylochi]